MAWGHAPEWRQRALHHTIGFWESWHQYDSLNERTFCMATHLTWVNFHKRHQWTYAQLIPYISLPPNQQKKLPAMLRQYLFTRSLIENVRFTA